MPSRGGQPPRRRRVPGAARRAVTYVSLTDADREAMLETIGVSIDRGALPGHPRRRALRPARSSSATAHRAGDRRATGGAGGAERPRRRGALVPRRGRLRPLRPGDRRRRPPARRVPDRLHAVPAGDEPGRPPGDLRVPDGDLRADRDGRLERLRLRRDDRRRGRLLHREARHRPFEGRPRGDA